MRQYVMVSVVSVFVVTTITFVIIYTPFYVVQHEPMDPYSVAKRVLKHTPLVDGHNGLPNNIRRLVHNQLSQVDFRQNLTDDPVWGHDACAECHTDIVRLREGLSAAHFFIASASCETEFRDAVEQTMEQIDLIKRFLQKYESDFQYADSPFGIDNAQYNGKIGGLIGIDGGHTIDNRLSVLRNYYELGARYLTLSHFCETPWVESSRLYDDGEETNSTGLSEFGRLVIREMNRLGMIIDLTHSSPRTQLDVLEVSRAPVLFSHSNAYALCDAAQNVHDDVLSLLREKGGLVMVSFDAQLVNCSTNASIADVANQINYLRNISGIDHIGIGSAFDTNLTLVEGLEDVTHYIDLVAHLAADEETPWTEVELEKLTGNNFLRFFAAVERVRDAMFEEGEGPSEEWIPEEDLRNHTECITPPEEPGRSYFYPDEL